MLNMNSKFKLDKHGNCCSAKAERHNKKEKKKICTLKKKDQIKEKKTPSEQQIKPVNRII